MLVTSTDTSDDASASVLLVLSMSCVVDRMYSI